MPKIYRAMLDDGGKPKVGSGAKMLGVRVAPDPHADIDVDSQGNVHPQTGGMSVAPDWRKLPYFLVPKRLKAIRPDARGSNELVCWSMGAGPFVQGAVNSNLVLRPDQNSSPKHGLVEPAQIMSIAEFQDYLTQTVGEWIRDED